MIEIGSDNYSLLIKKLNDFIRKFYLNKIVKGLIYFAAISLSVFLVLAALEYFFYFSSTVRKTALFSFLALFLGLGFFLVLLPLLRYFNVGKKLTHEQAAKIIGTHFPSVKDKLLNILQLKNTQHDFGSIELINASINQKIETLRPVPFVNAVKITENKQYLKYLVPPVLVLLLILFIVPKLLWESSERFVKYDTTFEKKAPFNYTIDTTKLVVVQYGDITVKTGVEGFNLPKNVDIVWDDIQHEMKKDSGQFLYEFKNVQTHIPFHFEANGFISKPYQISVIKKPVLGLMKLVLDYPAYTGLKDETLENIGDLNIPFGTKASWQIQTEHVDAVRFRFGDTALLANAVAENEFRFSKFLLQSQDYAIKIYNQTARIVDITRYTVNVTPDLNPSIFVREHIDSSNTYMRYYSGELNDDYGLSNLKFKYTIEPPKDSTKRSIKIAERKIEFQGERVGSFVDMLSIKDLNLKPGDRLSYYYEVYDNDGVRGAKSSKSQIFFYEVPTVDQIEKQLAQNSTELKKDLSQTLKDAKALQQEAKQLREKMLEKKNLTWEDKQNMQKLLQKQENLKQEIESLQQNLKQNQDQQRDIKDVDERIAEKQQKLQELFDQVMNPEMKELFQKLQDMMDKLNKEEVLKKLEELDMKNEKVEKELDRMLELYKNLEYEQKMQETADKLNDLSKEQERLSRETEQKQNAEDAKQKQDALNKKFDEAQKQIEELNKENKEQNGGKEDDFKDIKDDAKEADKEQQDASDKLDQKDSKSASKSQKKAADKMKEMSSKLSEKAQKQQADQNAEDMEMLRRLLKNLLYSSFEQEKLIKSTQTTSINAPAYPKLSQMQYKLKDDFKVAEDTLYKLASRHVELQKMIFDEVDKVKLNTKKSIQSLEDRNVGQSITDQQFAMTSYNNLTLFLSEVLQQMQKQQQDDENKKSGQCNNPKPGKGKKTMQSMKNMQQKLNEQLKDLSEKMKDGKKPSENGTPKSGRNGEQSKEIAEMAARQQAIRQALKEIEQSQNKAGKDGKKPFGNTLNEMMKEMDKTESDLVNKRITNELLKRQKDIEVKLLEAVEAEKNQDKEERRESKSAQDIQRAMPPALQEYLKKRQQEIELLRKTPPNLTPFYKQLVEKYFKSLN